MAAMKKHLLPNNKMTETKKPNPKGLIFTCIILIAIFALSLLSNYLFIHSPTISIKLETSQEHHHSTNLTVIRELPILQSDEKSNSFDHRLQFFLKNNCESQSQFFMTWISPAPLFGNREILALESLFKSHPNSCLIILSETLDSPIGTRILNPISNLGFRILPIKPDIPLLLTHTPALIWYKQIKTGEIDSGQIPFSQNLSNLLRLAFLYKYGGIYIDTDFIVLRNFSSLRNSIGAQSMNSETGDWARLNNAVLIFDKGHPLVMRFMEEFVIGFNGDKWGQNGPYLVSRVIESVSKTTEENREGDGLYNFTVMPPVAFYPLDWTRINGLFQRPKTKAHKLWAKLKVAQLKSESTYGVHLWNKQSSGLRIEEGSVIGRLISDCCILCKEIFIS